MTNNADTFSYNGSTIVLGVIFVMVFMLRAFCAMSDALLRRHFFFISHTSTEARKKLVLQCAKLIQKAIVVIIGTPVVFVIVGANVEEYFSPVQWLWLCNVVCGVFQSVYVFEFGFVSEMSWDTMVHHFAAFAFGTLLSTGSNDAFQLGVLLMYGFGGFSDLTVYCAMLYYRLGTDANTLKRLLKFAFVVNVATPFASLWAVARFLMIRQGYSVVARGAAFAMCLLFLPAHAVLVKTLLGLHQQIQKLVAERMPREHKYSLTRSRTLVQGIDAGPGKQDQAIQTDAFEYVALTGPLCTMYHALLTDEDKEVEMSMSTRLGLLA